MAYPAVRSVASTATDTDAANIVVTKPAGLAEGDLMVAFVGFWNPGGDRFHTTPSGWTAVQVAVIDTNNRALACYKKVANSGDAAASNFTFAWTGGSADKSTGAIYAITGAASGSEITLSEKDVSDTTGTALLTYTTTLTPLTAESLVICGWYAGHTGIASPMTASLPTLTPTTPLTENVDVGVRDGASGGVSLFCYSGEYAGLTEITSRSITTSVTLNGDGCAGIILLVNAPQNGAGTNTLLSVSPTTFSQSGNSGTIGTNALHEATPELFEQSGRGTTSTQWTAETKPSTSWNKET